MQNQIQTLELLQNMPELAEEQWRDVPGYEDLYEVSDQGRVLNLRSNKILKQNSRREAILYVWLRSADGVVSQCSVAHLVLLAFCGQKGKYAEWLDKDKTNNRLTNLKWTNRKNNRFTDDEVRTIRSRWMDGVSGADLSRAYRVSDATISGIICGYSYKDVK